jgi:holo-[acyl-carrier protein] synthase
VTVGIGTDLCDVRRVRATFERHGVRFSQRVLGPNEIKVWQRRCQRHPERGLRYLATRFSAKEAFSKAIGLGMRMPMTWRACEILNHPSGAPYICLHDALADWMAQRQWHALVSVSDETDYVSATVWVQAAAAPRA